MSTYKHIAPLLVFLFSFYTSFSNPEDVSKLIQKFKLSDYEFQKYSLLQKIDKLLVDSEKDDAIKTWNELIVSCENQRFYRGSGFCYFNLARLLSREGEYMEGYLAYQQSQENYNIIDDKVGLARVHNGLGILFKRLHKFEQSFVYYTQSSQLYMELNDPRLAHVYLNIGAMREEQNMLEEAETYLKNAEILLKEQNDSSALISCYINLGIVYEKSDSTNSAELYYRTSYDLSRVSGDIEDKIHALFHLGKFLFETGRNEEADELFLGTSDLYYTKNYFNYLPIEDRAAYAHLLGNLYQFRGDVEKAIEYLNQFAGYELENKRELSQLEMNRMELDALVEQSQLKQKQREYVIAISLAALAFSLLFIISLYKNYRQKQKANTALTEMDQLKTRLYNDITHELRTPLTLILGPLEQLLASGEAKRMPTLGQIRTMRKSAKNMLKLVNQMLDLSKIDARSLKLELVEEDVLAFIRMQFTSFLTLAEEKNIKCSSYFPPDQKILFFDAYKLEQILNNLISNAIKYTPENGQIFCFVSFPKPNKLEFTIQDTGIGIPESDIEKIFDRYYRTKEGESENTGTGIGLSLTKELVELMHGEIEVQSIVGEGTKFKFQLPLGKEHLQIEEYIILERFIRKEPIFKYDETITEAENNAIAIKDNGDLKTIMVVDDHPEIRSFIKDNLLHNYSVVTAANGEEGYSKATEIIPDVIVSDVVMPEKNGIVMTKDLKTDERTSHIPIILLSAKSHKEDKIKGLETGADAFIPKPFNMQELELRVKQLITQQEKLRKRFAQNINVSPKEITVNSADTVFIEKAMDVIEKNISNSSFEVRQFQEEMLMSRMQLFRKIKALTNQSPSDFIRTIRLKRAASLLEQNFGNIAQITYEVGFSNPSYFSKCFKEQFGKLPSEYIKK